MRVCLPQAAKPRSTCGHASNTSWASGSLGSEERGEKGKGRQGADGDSTVRGVGRCVHPTLLPDLSSPCALSGPHAPRTRFSALNRLMTNFHRPPAPASPLWPAAWRRRGADPRRSCHAWGRVRTNVGSAGHAKGANDGAELHSAQIARAVAVRELCVSLIFPGWHSRALKAVGRLAAKAACRWRLVPHGAGHVHLRNTPGTTRRGHKLRFICFGCLLVDGRVTVKVSIAESSTLAGAGKANDRYAGAAADGLPSPLGPGPRQGLALGQAAARPQSGPGGPPLPWLLAGDVQAGRGWEDLRVPSGPQVGTRERKATV